jgi:ubiquinone/menaquinone biosynthesis C-methylase UbiE
MEDSGLMWRSVDPSSLPTWLLDELRTAGRENLDAGHVALYDEKEDAGAPAEVRRLVRLGLGLHSTVVDLGAGTGQFTLAVARACASVVAVDISPLMLARLATKADAAGCTNVEVVQAGFLSYEHDGPPVDFVYSRWALHHLPDSWKVMALDRLRNILRPGGVLRLSDIVYSFEPSEIGDQVQSWRSALPIEATTQGEWVRADIDEHVRDEHSTFTWLLEPMMERSGFRIEEAIYSTDRFRAEYVARAV